MYGVAGARGEYIMTLLLLLRLRLLLRLDPLCHRLAVGRHVAIVCE